MAKRKFDFLICGYYGFDNIGDDSMLHAIVKNLEGFSIAVLSKGGDMPRGVEGVASFDRFLLLSVFRAIKQSRVVMLGGGNLLQDLTSKRSLSYYLWLLRVARLFGKKTMLYANGIGPASAKGAKKIAKVLKKVDCITVREPDSQSFLAERLIPSILTADEVFADRDFCDDPVKIGKEYILVSLRSWHRLDDRFVPELAQYFADVKAKHGLFPVFACLQDSADAPVCEAVSALVPDSVVLKDLSRQQFAHLVKNSRFVLGMRLHALIYALRENVDSIGIVYDTKVSSFLKYSGNQKFVNAVGFTAESLEKHTRDLLESKADLSAVSQKMRTAAEMNAAAAKALLGGEKQ